MSAGTAWNSSRQNDSLSLALSGERPARELLARFAGIGLVRGEYVFRALGLYPTHPVAQEQLFAYLDELCTLSPGQVVYRTMEVTAAEANTLTGVEEVIDEDAHSLMGIRGVRRHMRHPESLSAEFRVLREIHRKHPNLVVISPFVSAVDEFVWFRDKALAEVGPDCRTGTMIETPAAVLDADALVAAGARTVVVGTNDLGSLLAARPRLPDVHTELVPGMARALRHVRHASNADDYRMHVAGYLTPPLMEAASQAGADTCVVHYSDLPRLLGDAYAEIPYLDHLARVKKKTRAAIAEQARNKQAEGRNENVRAGRNSGSRSDGITVDRP
ncbi:putative PEP-binding protein [Streptomyces sp. NPDC051211]|uniref:putative PEP-binding protein n=1 Tax=Streptomyces sp. NPDC051211 TaxID=3154643 RepID=UPI00344D2E12